MIQEEGANDAAKHAARCTAVKATVLEGDPCCPNLKASSVYNTKYVHYLSIVTDCINLTQKEKLVDNVDTNDTQEYSSTEKISTPIGIHSNSY